MPHIRFRALEPQTVQALSATLINELQPLINAPREDFTVNDHRKLIHF